MLVKTGTMQLLCWPGGSGPVASDLFPAQPAASQKCTVQFKSSGDFAVSLMEWAVRLAQLPTKNDPLVDEVPMHAMGVNPSHAS